MAMKKPAEILEWIEIITLAAIVIYCLIHIFVI